jgi:hypothetical protein
MSENLVDVILPVGRLQQARGRFVHRSEDLIVAMNLSPGAARAPPLRVRPPRRFRFHVKVVIGAG